MSSLEKDLYKNIKVQTPDAPKPKVQSRAYRGLVGIIKSNLYAELCLSVNIYTSDTIRILPIY